METTLQSTASHFTNPETPPIVDLSHIVRRFGDRTVLDDISLRVERGELFGLLRPVRLRQNDPHQAHHRY